MDKVHYELEVRRAATQTWAFNQRQATLSGACRHEEIVRGNLTPGGYHDDVRIVEVRTTRTVIKNSG
jgi:hypothetical protein